MAYTASLLNARLARSMEVTRGGDCVLSQDGLLGPPTPGGAETCERSRSWTKRAAAERRRQRSVLPRVLAERGYRILVVDVDPQASASLWLGRGREPGLYSAIVEKRDLEPFVRATAVAGLDIIAGSRELAAVDDLRGRIGIQIMVWSKGLAGYFPDPYRFANGRRQ